VPHKHSRLTEAGRLVWFIERLWYLARELPVQQVPLAQIANSTRTAGSALARQQPAGPLPTTRGASSTLIYITRSFSPPRVS
jgi:hypothetical protein